MNSLADFDTTGKSGMNSVLSIDNVPADGVYQLSVMLHITPKTASATKSDLVFQFTGGDGTGWPNHTFHAVVDDSQTFAQQLSFSTSVSLKAGQNTLRIQCGNLNTEYLVFVDELTLAQLVNGVYHNGDDFDEVHTLTEALNFNNDDGFLVDGATGGPRFMFWQTLANKVLGFIKSLSTTITAFRTGDVIPVDGPSGTAKMSKDDLQRVIAENALDSINKLTQTATEIDLVAGNHLVVDTSEGAKKLPAEILNKERFEKNLLDDVILGYTYADSTDRWFNNPLYGFSKFLTKTSSSDVIVVSNTFQNIKVGVFFFNADFSLNHTDYSLWDAAGSKTYSNFEGWVGIRLMNRGMAAIETLSAQIPLQVKAVVASFNKFEKPIFDMNIGSLVKGNLTSVIETTQANRFCSNFISVKPGEKYKVNLSITGWSKSSNITGVACYTTNSTNGFVGWIFANWVMGVKTDSEQNWTNRTFTIPEGVNYITISGSWQIQGIFSKFNSIIEKIGYEENKENDLIFVNPLVSTGDASLFKFSDGTTLLVDTSRAESLTNLQLALSTLDVSHLDYFIISHYHNDHIDNFDYLVSSGEIDSDTIVFLPDTPNLEFLQNFSERIYNDYLHISEVLTGLGCRVIQPDEWEYYFIGSSKIEFFNTDHSSYYVDGMDYNDCSLCHYITIAK